MTATMNAAEGVGLAANQVGVDLQLFVFDCPDDDGVGCARGHLAVSINGGYVGLSIRAILASLRRRR